MNTLLALLKKVAFGFLYGVGFAVGLYAVMAVLSNLQLFRGNTDSVLSEN